MTTAAWLAASHSIPKVKVDSQLVSRYSAALRPGPEWLQALLRVLEHGNDAPQSEETLQQLLLRTPVLRALQDKTLNEPELIKAISIETIAQQSAEYEKLIRDQTREETRQELDKEHEKSTAEKLRDIEAAQKSRVHSVATANSNRFTRNVQTIVAVISAAVLAASLFFSTFSAAFALPFALFFLLLSSYSTCSLVGLISADFPWKSVRKWSYTRNYRSLSSVLVESQRQDDE